LKYKLQQWFHVEPLLILDTINPGPAFRPKSVHKITFPSHVAATGPPSKKRQECMLSPSGACHRRRAVTSLMPPPPYDTPLTPPSPFRDPWTQLPRPLHRCRRRSATEEEGAPTRKHPNIIPSCHIIAPTLTDAPRPPARTSPPPQSSAAAPTSANVTQVSPLAVRCCPDIGDVPHDENEQVARNAEPKGEDEGNAEQALVGALSASQVRCGRGLNKLPSGRFVITTVNEVGDLTQPPVSVNAWKTSVGKLIKENVPVTYRF
jgi:hypothetical protein